jgi:hypothetical protein
MAAVIAAIIALCAAILVAWLGRRLKISEFRQAWINDLRKGVADYLGVTQRWFKGHKEKQDEWKLFSMGNEASVILYRIKMRINPLENVNKKSDDEFLAALEKLRNPKLAPEHAIEAYWGSAAEDAVEKARLLFKREWEITKRMGMPWSG